MKFRLLITTCACVLAVAPPSSAGDTSFLSFGVGYYDVFDDDGAVDLRTEYRPDVPVLFEDLNPWLGAELTSDGSAWAGGGVLYDAKLTQQWSLIPSFGVGLYTQGGSDHDLDHPIEFRTQLEIAYDLKDSGNRIGAAISHFSNAGFGDSNPGAEALNFYYHIPWN